MIYHAEMEGRVVKQWFGMGSACRFMALAGLLCLALLLSGCGTTYISAPDYGRRYEASSSEPVSPRPRVPRSVRITVSEAPRPKASTVPADLVGLLRAWDPMFPV